MKANDCIWKVGCMFSVKEDMKKKETNFYKEKGKQNVGFWGFWIRNNIKYIVFVWEDFLVKGKKSNFILK